MKVNNNGPKPTNTTAAAATTRARDVKGETKAGKKASIADAEILSGSAKINMSDRAQMMQKAKEIAKSDTVDDAKVARIQKLIDEGTYRVDASAVADKLVDEHLLTGE